MILAEMRYLGNFLAVVLAIIAVAVVSVAIGGVAHLSATATAAVFLVVGGATLIGGMVFFVRRQLRDASTGGVSSAPEEARYLPLLLDVVPLCWFTYSLADMCVALHRGEHVSRDSAICNCWLFVWWLHAAYEKCRRFRLVLGTNWRVLVASGRREPVMPCKKSRSTSPYFT